MNSNSTDPREIRKFGLIAFVFFGLLCAAGVWRHKPLPVYLFGALALLGLGFILAPAPLKPVYGAWIRTARFMGKIITAVMLGAAYYGVITPAALLKRLFGGRPLPTGPDKEAASYWVTRSEPAQPRERFLKRY